MTEAAITQPKRATPAGFGRTLGQILAKDVLLEWRARSRVNATVFFALLTLLLFSFAVGPNHAALQQNAAGYLWLALLLASVLSLAESMRLEYASGAMHGLRLLPVSMRGVFVGKAVVNTLFLSLLGFLLLPVAMALYDVSFALGLGAVARTVVLGAAAFSAPGTLYAAMVAQARARDVLLPLLLFPVLVPGLLACVKATSLAMYGDPMQQLSGWWGLLIGFNVVYWLLCAAVFERVVEP